MFSQTIALFRFQMRGIVYGRLLVLYLVLLLGAFFLGGFVGELALINSLAVQAASVAEFIRYSFVILVMLTVALQVVDDFDYRQFERLLTMPIARWQYIVAEVMVISAFCALLVMPVFPLMALLSDSSISAYWVVSLWLELVLVGLVAMLGALSLEKVAAAVMFSLAIYLLAKLSGFIALMVSESVRLSDGEAQAVFMQWVFEAILYVLPSHSSFASNDVFFESSDLLHLFSVQAGFTVVYALLLLAACLIDFYRKELSR